MTDPEPQLDKERIEGILELILIAIRDNYQRGPVSRDRCFESLNALAAAVVMVIHGADGPGGEAQEFFDAMLMRCWLNTLIPPAPAHDQNPGPDSTEPQ
jgi:hypothetical protein